MGLALLLVVATSPCFRRHHLQNRETTGLITQCWSIHLTTHNMDLSIGSINNMNEGSPNQLAESEVQSSLPAQFRNKFLTTSCIIFSISNPFGRPNNYQPYGQPPLFFQGAYQLGNQGQPIQGRFQGVQLEENVVQSRNQLFQFVAKRSHFGVEPTLLPIRRISQLLHALQHMRRNMLLMLKSEVIAMKKEEEEHT